MDLKQKLLDMSRAATGDDAITVAGDFAPKGMTWKVAAGAAAGNLIGDAAGGDLGGAIGATVGGATGYAVGSAKTPPVVVMAASPEKLYLLTTGSPKGIVLSDHLILFDTLDRDHLAVEMHQRVLTRTVVVTDESTGHEYRLEGRRIVFHHMNDLLDALQDAAEED